MPCEIMTADQVAELLQVTRDLVYQLATRGELPGRKLGRIWRFSREAINEFMREDVTVHPSSRADARQGATESNG